MRLVTGSLADHDVQAAFASVLVDEWRRAGLADVVACPGSRSTPILVALAEAAERGDLRLHVVFDERSAAFLALGLARSGGTTGPPAAVVTTSGTAALELYSAIAEADESGVALLAVTADRPTELHDCGAPQTVRQEGAFGRSVRWEWSPGVPVLASSASWRSSASRAFSEAAGAGRRPGPVHVNLAFREPLLGSADTVLWSGPTGSRVREGRPDGAPWHRAALSKSNRAGPVPQSEIVEMLASAGERGLVLAGPGAGDAGAVAALSGAKGWPVLAEPLSGCRYPGTVAAAHSLLRTELVRSWRPELVLRLGLPWLSRTVNEWLSELSCPQILVDPWGTWPAPDRAPGLVAVASPVALCEAVCAAAGSSAGAGSNEWAGRWAAVEAAAQGAIGSVLGDEEHMTEPAIAREVVRWAPDGSTLMVSASMPIRDVEWWSEPREGLKVVANRGANGIDGVLSTAMGVALGMKQPAKGAGQPAGGTGRHANGAGQPAKGAGRHGGRALALVGDLAFLYDSSALAAAGKLGARLDIVVIDNDGGGIFNFLPQAAEQPPERFERLWGTPHGLDLCAIAGSFGVEAERAADLPALFKLLGQPGDHGVRVIVATTRRAENVAVHKCLHSAVEEAVLGLGL